MPKLNRFSKSTDPDPLVTVDCERARRNITNTVRAIHTFVMCSCIATGILQMMSLAFDEISPEKIHYLRTYSSRHASEASMKEYVRNLIYLQLANPQATGIIQIIQSKQSSILGDLSDLLEKSA